MKVPIVIEALGTVTKLYNLASEKMELRIGHDCCKIVTGKSPNITPPVTIFRRKDTRTLCPQL